MEKWLQCTAIAAGIAGGLMLTGAGIAFADQGGQRLALVDEVAGRAAHTAATPGMGVGEPENKLGMGSDLMGSTNLGDGPVGGTRDDVTLPAKKVDSQRLSAVGKPGGKGPHSPVPAGSEHPADY